MKGTTLYWVDGPWRGRLAMAARPRGGDWLAHEMAEWKACGASTVVSLLEVGEERDLELCGEGAEIEAAGMRFRSFPIADRDVPASERAFGQLLEDLELELSEGRDVVVHCRQGIGRTGLVAAGLLIQSGVDSAEAIDALSAARSVPVPETAAQREWIEHFAEMLATAR